MWNCDYHRVYAASVHVNHTVCHVILPRWWYCYELFDNSKGWSSLGPRPKPTPAQIASSITRVHDTGSDPRWGGLGLGPRLGVVTPISTILTHPWEHPSPNACTEQSATIIWFLVACYLQVTRLTNFLSFVICVPIRVSVDVLYCITTEEDHRSVVETFGWKTSSCWTSRLV